MGTAADKGDSGAVPSVGGGQELGQTAIRGAQACVSKFCAERAQVLHSDYTFRPPDAEMVPGVCQFLP